jgi:HAMP domain-containing protein
MVGLSKAVNIELRRDEINQKEQQKKKQKQQAEQGMESESNNMKHTTG